MGNRLIQLREFDRICEEGASGGRPGFVEVDGAGTFAALEAFILGNRREEDGDLSELLAITSVKGVGKCIQARNYVGVVSFSDGTTIEILPKIGAREGDDFSLEKDIFLRMLHAVFRINMRSSGSAKLATKMMGIFEALISMFLDEADGLVKRGLRSDYVAVEGNVRFLKGKMLFSQNVRHNSAHRERFYVRHDVYSLNRAENRILKSTLVLLSKISRDSANKKGLSRLLSALADIPESCNVDADFSKCKSDRNTAAYQTIISWCEVFLKGKSFSTFEGSKVAMALLFPMEKLFEAYVAWRFKREFGREWNVRTQEASRYLYDRPGKGQLRPDIACRDRSSEILVILDTKWKRIESHKDISQADLYQMYAYFKKYGADETVLIYPANPRIDNDDVFFASFENAADGDASLKVIMYDFLNEEKSLDRLKGMLGDVASKAKLMTPPFA